MNPVINWQEDGKDQSAHWRSESGAPPPKRIVVADDRMTADTAYRLACEGTALLWRGDYQNARQLLQAMARRAEPRKNKTAAATPSMHACTPPRLNPLPQAGEETIESLRALQLKEAFNLHRQAQSQRARTLNMLLLPFNADHSIPLRRAPDVSAACLEAYGATTEPYVLSLRGLLGLVGAHQWRKNGVEIPRLKSRIHPHYGVFSPIRGEYVDLVADAPLPKSAPLTAFDIGTGTGVLAAVLAQRGINRIIATDQDNRALACARENLQRLNLSDQVEVMQADLFPQGKADLIVCNPPWLPARPSSPLEYAVYDPESRMLKGFLNGLASHLEVGGEGWLIISDLAEHLGLRSRTELLALIETAGLKVISRIKVRPHHTKVTDAKDPLHAARAAEITSLWRIAADNG